MKTLNLLKSVAIAGSVLVTSLAYASDAALKVGIISGPEAEVAEVAKEQAKKLYNLDVELVQFNDYVIPNLALSSGDVDINAFQHKPFLEKQMEDRGLELAVVGNTFVYPIAAYSKKLKPVTKDTINEQGVFFTSPRGETFFIKDNSKIAIPNDPTNLGRSLLLLQKQNLIKLEDNVGLLPDVFDIIENPHNIEIIELDAALLPKSLDDDTIDVAIINNAFAGQINFTPSKNGVFVEDKDSPYVNVIVSREDNKNDERVQQFVKSYQTEAVAEKANEVFNGGAIKGW